MREDEMDEEQDDAPTTPRVFVSYSHDSEEHRAWVLALAHRLAGHGVDVVLDQWDMAPGMDLPKFMENGLSSSEWVIAICTASFNKKANERAGGVGYESRIVTADLFNGAGLTDHVIPVVRDATTNRAVPVFLSSLLWVDMCSDENYDTSYDELLRRIHNEPAVPKPPIGTNPFAPRNDELWVPLEHRPDRYIHPAAEGSFEFPYENNSGRLALGSGDYTFTSKWSGCGPTSVYFLSDPGDIHSVALVEQPGTIDSVGDAFRYDSSSRSRVASVGDVALFRNQSDYWLAVLIDSVTRRDRTAPGSTATLCGTYRILSDRSSVFSS